MDSNSKDIGREKDAAKKYQQQLQKAITAFSGYFMNNTKWRVVFKVLCFEHPETCCMVKLIGEDTSRKVNLFIKRERFEQCFLSYYLADNIIFGCGPIAYKEIERLEFPKHQEFKRINRNEVLTPLIKKYDTDIIKEDLEKIGTFEFEETEDKLMLIGYR